MNHLARKLATWCAVLGVLSLPLLALGPLDMLIALASIVCGVSAAVILLVVIFSRGGRAEGGFSLVPVFGITIGIAAACMAIWIPLSGLLETQVRVKANLTNKALQKAAERFSISDGNSRSKTAQRFIPDPDPFGLSPADLINVTTDSMGNFKLWSIGPDQVDQQGAFSYEPTNGTVSGGDVLVTGSLGLLSSQP